MSVHDWDQWKIDNPDWERYYTPDNAPGVGEVGEWKNKLIARNPGWNDVLHKASKAPGSKVKKISQYGKKKESVCRATYRGWTHGKADEEEKTS